MDKDFAPALLAQPEAAPPTLPALLTASEVAALLRINLKTVYDLNARGLLPGARRLGRRALRWHRDTVLEWLRTGQGRANRR
jgi:excisionase family DNA binding protein